MNYKIFLSFLLLTHSALSFAAQTETHSSDSYLEKVLQEKYIGSEMYLSVGGTKGIGHNEELEDEKISIRIHGTARDFLQKDTRDIGTVETHSARDMRGRKDPFYKRIKSGEFIKNLIDRFKQNGDLNNDKNKVNQPVIVTEGYIHPDDYILIQHLKKEYGVNPVVFVIPEPDRTEAWIMQLRMEGINDENTEKLLRKGTFREIIDSLSKMSVEDILMRQARIADIQWIFNQLHEKHTRNELTPKQSKQLDILTTYYKRFYDGYNRADESGLITDIPLEGIRKAQKDSLSVLQRIKNSRQIQRVKYIPAPINDTAFTSSFVKASIPALSTGIVWFFSGNEVEYVRALGYLTFGVGITWGFGLISQSVMNYFNYWSDFTRESLNPSVRRIREIIENLNSESFIENTTNLLAHYKLARKVTTTVGSFAVDTLDFMSARGDMLIGAPLMGIFTLYLFRLILGPTGETDSVLTLSGVWMVIWNTVLGCIAGGPYNEMITHLRAVGAIKNKNALWLSVFDQVKMDLGKVADFGYQNLYKWIQLVLGITLWSSLYSTDKLYPKTDYEVIEENSSIKFLQTLYQSFEQRKEVEEAFEHNRRIDSHKINPFDRIRCSIFGKK